MLEVQIVRNNGTIDFNFEDIKDALASELELYKNLVFTEDTKANAKKTVAELRKLKKQISDKRIEVKKLYMQPYTDFEAKVKELDKLINEPITFINEQIDAFEQKCIEEKRELINDIYLELVSRREDIAGYAELNRVYDSKWENTSTSKKTIQESITNYLDGVANDIAAIKSMAYAGMCEGASEGDIWNTLKKKYGFAKQSDISKELAERITKQVETWYKKKKEE